MRREAIPTAEPAAMSEGDDDILGIASDVVDPLVRADTVNAVCAKIDTYPYKAFGKRFVFTFTVEDKPDTKLRMFVRIVDGWKRSGTPTSSKLYKMACIASGKRVVRRDKITKTLFIGKSFSCRLKHVGNGAAAYSIIDELIERRTG